MQDKAERETNFYDSRELWDPLEGRNTSTPKMQKG